MNVRLLSPAQHELDEAVAWYAVQAPGLGDAFLIETIKTQDGDDLLVIAIAHQHRKPGYWRDRLQST